MQSCTCNIQRREKTYRVPNFYFENTRSIQNSFNNRSDVLGQTQQSLHTIQVCNSEQNRKGLN